MVIYVGSCGFARVLGLSVLSFLIGCGRVYAFLYT